jgi:hypothetical protein
MGTISLFSDHDKLWIGTDRGICYKTSSTWVDLSSDPEAPHSVVDDITKDSSGNILIATSTGLFVYNDDTIRWEIREQQLQVPKARAIAYPNPANKIVRFTNTEIRKEIYDLKGNLIEIVIKNENIWKPQKHLSAGVYLILEKNTDVINKQKIVITK